MTKELKQVEKLNKKLIKEARNKVKAKKFLITLDEETFNLIMHRLLATNENKNIATLIFLSTKEI